MIYILGNGMSLTLLLLIFEKLKIVPEETVYAVFFYDRDCSCFDWMQPPSLYRALRFVRVVRGRRVVMDG